ncbi:type 1 fimbrial protein [Enterobacter cloacae]|uniref:fimbrial protein n=1 Tax=Enterobacter cloacae TaxID=550 RepID=UPI0034A334CE
MKKLTLALSFAALTGVSGLAQAASTGTINFEGLLTATTCDVNVDGQGPDATVVLPTMGVSQLASAGQTGGKTGFNMSLSNCAGTLKTASAFFEAGPTVDLVTGRLKNTFVGSGDDAAATNVSLQLLDGSSASYAAIQAGNANQVTSTTYVDIASGSANLPYAVQYYADAATTAGKVASQVVYSLQYK